MSTDYVERAAKAQLFESLVIIVLSDFKHVVYEHVFVSYGIFTNPKPGFIRRWPFSVGVVCRASKLSCYHYIYAQRDR